MQKKKVIAAVALVVAAVSLVLFLHYQNKSSEILVMKDYLTDEIYLEVPLGEDHIFSVSYTHSVNKSMVEEYYLAQKNSITLVKARYHHFGAGVATELNEGEYLTYDDEGYMVINNMQISVPQLIYKVGTVSDHILHIGDESWHLKDYAPELSSVIFEIK